MSAEQGFHYMYNLSPTYLCNIFPIMSSVQKSHCVPYHSLVTWVLSTFFQYLPCLQNSFPFTPPRKYILFFKNLLTNHLIWEAFLNPPPSAHLLIPGRFCHSHTHLSTQGGAFTWYYRSLLQHHCLPKCEAWYP